MRIVKFQRVLTEEERKQLHIEAMWLAFLRAPSNATGPGEPVDLGEIGTTREKDWVRLTPYSVTQRG
jgi:hypothetical protein